MKPLPKSLSKWKKSQIVFGKYNCDSNAFSNKISQSIYQSFRRSTQSGVASFDRRNLIAHNLIAAI
jgi:hypothetical protein